MAKLLKEMDKMLTVKGKKAPMPKINMPNIKLPALKLPKLKMPRLKR